MCNAPFRELLALIDLDGDADLPQNLLVDVILGNSWIPLCWRLSPDPELLSV